MKFLAPFRRPSLTRLYEYAADAAPRVDPEAGVIHNVKILGRHSTNDGGAREYSDEALADAIRLYENAQVNLNHPEAHDAGVERSFEHGIGWLQNCRLEPDGAYGDLHVIKSHPYAGVLFESAARNPKRFGLSHNADGEVIRTGDGKNVVKRLKKVRSVDVVQKPATNTSLFESEFPDSPKARTMKIKIGKLLESRPELKRLKGHLDRALMEGTRCATAMEADDPVPAYEDEEVDAPADDGSVATPDDATGANAILMAIIQAIMACLGKSQGLAERRMKEAAADPDGQGAPSQGQAPSAMPPATTAAKISESVNEAINRHPAMKKLSTLLERIEEQDSEKECRDLLESKNREVDSVRIRALAALSPAERETLIESWPEKTTAYRVPRPERSFPAIFDGGHSGTMIPKNAKELALAIRD